MPAPESSSKSSRIVTHVDFDYFYAQCEELRNRALKGRPLVVCVFSGRTDDSGVVSTANYVARKYGVKSGIPIRIAKSRLTDAEGATFLPLDMPYYSNVSEQAMSVIQAFSDRFEQVGIDECYVDITRQATSYADARIIASKIKQTISEEVGITCSVGVAPNKMIAKIASDFQKPDGLTVVEPKSVESFVAPLGVDKISGIGPKTSARLEEMGVTTIGDLSKADQFRLAEEFGRKMAAFLHAAARGVDEEPVEEAGEKKQISRIITLKDDATTSAQMSEDLRILCESVTNIVRSRRVSFKTISVLLFLDNLDQKSKSKTLKTHTSNLEIVRSTAIALLRELVDTDGTEIKVRRLGIRLSDFQDSTGQNTISAFMESPGDRQ